MKYAQHFSTLQTPQTEQADKRQVANSAGGFSFQVDDWKRLDRFLILGNEGGSYYASERKLTLENASVVQSCLVADGKRTVDAIVSVSDSGRAPKNDPAIFALAIAAGCDNAVARAAALSALPRVCRTGTHLFQFVESVKNFRGWGRGLKRAVSDWYAQKDERTLCYQLCKYQQRNGWSHRDLFRLAHPLPKYPIIYRYLVAGSSGLGERKVGKWNYGPVGELPEYLAAFEELKHADKRRTIELIRKHRFTHEMVASEHKNSPEVWETLLPDMPFGALVRNLGKLTAVGLVKPMSSASGLVVKKLGNTEALRKSRLHPIALLSALRVYANGRGVKGSLSWNAVSQVIDALDAAFYESFGNIEPSGKNTLLALDVSGSMGSAVAGIPGLTCRDVSAALAMVTARVERCWHVVGFTGGSRIYHYGFGGRASNTEPLTVLNISPRQRLNDVVRTISGLPFGTTCCAQPILYALKNKLDVDVFHVYTDSETYAGTPHPHQALNDYRKKTGRQAKLAVVGMVSNGFSIADPSDPDQLDVVGCDTATPNVLAEFARGW